MSYAIELKDFHAGAAGESDHMLLEVSYDGGPVASVTVTWHGDFELEVSASKYFGGKTPGVATAWELSKHVLDTINDNVRDRGSNPSLVFEGTNFLAFEVAK